MAALVDEPFDDRGDGDDAPPPDPGETRAVLRNVAAYRQLRKHVRGKANSGLVFGAIMLGIWWLAFGQRGDFRSPFSVIYLGLAAFEFLAGAVNKLFPSAEGVLLDGLVLFAFGTSNLARGYLDFQANRQPNWVFVAFGAYWAYSGVRTVQSYVALRRAFARRPTRDQLRWFDELVRDIRRADPENDPTALDLPTRPPVRGKLLGDTALFLTAGSDDVIVAARDGVLVDPGPPAGPDRGPVGYLSVHGHEFGRFPLDPDNWRNYAAWKGLPTALPAPRPPADRGDVL